MTRRLLIATAVSLLAVGSATASATLAWKTISHSSKTGNRAQAQIYFVGKGPYKYRVKVAARPNQKVVGLYQASCRKGPISNATQGIVNGTTPLTKAIPLPFTRPDTCVVSLQYRLAKHGTVTVQLQEAK